MWVSRTETARCCRPISFKIGPRGGYIYPFRDLEGCSDSRDLARSCEIGISGTLTEAPPNRGSANCTVRHGERRILNGLRGNIGRASSLRGYAAVTGSLSLSVHPY